MTPEEIGDYRKLLTCIIEDAEEKLSELPLVALPWKFHWGTHACRNSYEGGKTYASIQHIGGKWYYSLPYLEWYDEQQERTEGRVGGAAESKEDAMACADAELKKRDIILMESRWI